MKNLFTLSLLTLVLSSCGSGGSSGGNDAISNPNLTNPSQAFFNTMDDGIYVPQNNSCKTENNEHFKIVIVKALNELSFIKQLYLEVDCLTEFHSIAITHTFISANLLPDGYQLTNLSLIDAQISINLPGLLNDYNGQYMFQFDDWILNNAKSIIDRAPQPGAPIVYQSGTVSSLYLKLISPTVLLVKGIQYNKQ